MIAEAAARGAGALRRDALAHAGRGARGGLDQELPTDLVSEADLEAERAIREVLLAERPDDAILGEEGEDTPGSSGLRWIVDPLDGTVNYLFGIPQWCVSVACEGRAGVIFDPCATSCGRRARRPGALVGDALDRLAARPRDGARRHRLRLRGGRAPRPGAPGRRAAAAGARHPPRRQRRARPRVDGGGPLDAYYERGVQRWDVAAGALLCPAPGSRSASSKRATTSRRACSSRPGIVDALAAIVG